MEHDRAFENADQVDRPIRVVGVDLGAQLAYSGSYLVSGKEDAKLTARHRLVSHAVARAGGAKVDVRSGCFSWYRGTEGIIWDSGTLQKAAKPGAFCLVGVQCNVNPPTVIETERPMQRCISPGADREGFPELPLKRR